MGSVLEERHKQAALVCRLLQRIPIEAQARGWAPEERNHRSQKTLKKLEELCAPEIIKAILSHWAEAGLCGVYIGVVQKPPCTALYILREDPEIIYSGIRNAVSGVAVSGVQFHEHVEACVAKAIVEEWRELVKELTQSKPHALLKLCSTTTLDRAKFITAHLSAEQRRALGHLLFRELGKKARPLRMDKEPTMPDRPTLKQKQAWWHWYIWRLKMHEPESKALLGGVPQIMVVGDGDRMLTNRGTGKPVDPLGPINAKTYMQLGREQNKHGHPIKDPESKSRIAKSLGVSRSTLQRYLEADVPVKLTPDGKGGVYTEFKMNDLLAAVEISARKRRGADL